MTRTGRREDDTDTSSLRPGMLPSILQWEDSLWLRVPFGDDHSFGKDVLARKNTKGSALGIWANDLFQICPLSFPAVSQHTVVSKYLLNVPCWIPQRLLRINSPAAWLFRLGLYSDTLWWKLKQPCRGTMVWCVCRADPFGLQRPQNLWGNHEAREKQAASKGWYVMSC